VHDAQGDDDEEDLGKALQDVARGEKQGDDDEDGGQSRLEDGIAVGGYAGPARGEISENRQTSGIISTSY
jgi:hypothetical protein